MRKFLVAGMALLFCFAAAAQEVRVRVTEANGAALESAAVKLFDDKGVFVRGGLTDSAGLAVLPADSGKRFVLQLSIQGYRSVSDTFVMGGGLLEKTARMQVSANTLNEVTITQQRPLLRQEDDKTIVDAEQLAEASTNGYEMLEKTPGLFVDQDGNIYLSSTTPATVYINGRELKMSRSDIASMLKNLPPGSIERIELLRTPSAKYDASGSGGVVNVVLKKGVRLGTNGSLYAGSQQGVYGNRYAGFNLNSSQGSTNVYVNAGASLNNNYQQLNTNRVLTGDTALQQKAFTKYPGKNAYLNAGFNRDLNEKWNIAYDGRLGMNPSKSLTQNTNDIVQGTDHVLGSTLALVQNNNNSLVNDNEITLTHTPDTMGSEWKTRAAYTFAKNDLDQTYQNSSVLGSQDGAGNVDAMRHFVNLQSDLTLKFPHSVTAETGVKSTFLWFENTAAYTLGQVPDPNRSNVYRYKENLNAAYVQASKGFGKFILKLGLRAENTNMDGHQIAPKDTSFTVHRTDLFPYVYFSRKIMSIASFEIRAYLVARRTIARPSYEQLNPFPKYVDQFMSEIGNPRLRPQFTQNYEANVTAGDHPIFAAGYNETKDLFTNVFYQSPDNISQAYRGYDNIGHNREYYLRGLAAIPPGGKYFGMIGGQFNYNVYEGLYEGLPLKFVGKTWLFFTYQQLKLDRRSTITVNGWWRLPGALQFYQLSEMGGLTFSANRKFLKDKLTASLSVSDILYTNNNTFTVRQGSVDASGYRGGDTRRVGISLRYNFGIRKKDEHQDMFSPSTIEDKK